MVLANGRRFLSMAAMLAAAAPAQVRWEHSDYLPVTSGPMVWDSARDQYVILAPPNGVGNLQTWEWNRAAGWRHRFPNAPLGGTGDVALAYDASRGVAVLLTSVGGFFPPAVTTTWEWDGTAWTNAAPAAVPAARSGHALVFDSVRDRVVVFGGIDVASPNPGFLADTWEYDGTTWVQRAVAGPSARSEYAMAFDSVRGETILFGGRDALGQRGDTWSFDGVAWLQRSTTGPSARSQAAMAFDLGSARVALFGGSPGFGAYLDDTWEWDGVTWIPRAPAVRPPARRRAGIASDPVGGGVLLVCGAEAASAFADVWRWDGASWTLLDDVAQPAPRHSHAAAFDEARGDMLVFGGIGTAILGDFWRWNGAAWTAITAPGPSARTRAEMAYDATRTETVLFGGELPGFTNETWVWDGTAWTQRSPAASPSARVLHAMTCDRDRDRVVLFGGAAGGLLGDTWEWDGSTWLLRATTGPAPRHGHEVAYDPDNAVTVLYGGTGAGFPFGVILADTWLWDGGSWIQPLPANDAGPRREFAMAYDDARGRVVVFGDQFSNAVHEWDGVDWSLRVPAAGSPPPRTRTSLVFDSWRATTFLFGGQSIGPNHSDVWSYGPVTPATAAPFGSGCAGAPGVPTITAARPWLGDTVPVALGNGVAGAVAVIWGGLSDTIGVGGVALPLDLTPLAMPGCFVFTSSEAVTWLLAGPAGDATVSFAVPNAPALLGVRLYFQGAFADASANAAGWAVSGALLLTVGGR